MKLERISLQNFRNYSKISINLGADLVLILGDNAAGKTNFLESIYYLSRLRSFRAPDNLLVKNGEDFFNLQGRFGEKDLEVIVQVLPNLRRQYKINDLKTKRGLWQSFTTVLFVPNDLNLFQLGPILRRKYLDETISQIDLAYNLDLESLDHILKQKAALLEQIYANQSAPSELEFWNQQLASVAVRITDRRQQLVDFLNQKLSSQTNLLTGFENKFELRYKRMAAHSEPELLADLKAHEAAEIRSGKNLIGPHRDDFEIYKDEKPNLFNSSRGELRTQILCLKLLQAEYLGQTTKKPLILLDDVFSELDEVRRTKLIENLRGHQIFITSTEEHHLPKIAKDAQILKVEQNEIK
ncbi:MAG: DNA replication and repair protein RecF [Candidatus Doudnabacteria bacterium]|nr:DNA replication and repair protein RecF [Candidatus Doudnabacteria bacterium]